MAANVSGVSCDFVKGHVPDLGTRLQTWHNLGQNGTGGLDVGQEADGFVLHCEKWGTDAAINTWAASLKALQGTAGNTMENDHGETETNLMISHVSQARKEPIKYEGSDQKIGVVMIAGVKTA